MDDLKVTSLAELQTYAKGQVVRLPDFAEGQPFVARLMRPSMLVLVKEGKIPNQLLTTANKLFVEGSVDNTQDEHLMDSIFGVLETFCKASFLEPTYDEIKNSGMELTDEQLIFVFNYAQSGVKALDSFRGESKNNRLPGTGTMV